DKGSVELIKRFGSLDQALDRAAEVEKKSYRESLLQNRDVILASRQLVTLDRNVPIELNVEAMHAGEPDLDALRQLFTELEFTSFPRDSPPAARGGEFPSTAAPPPPAIAQILQPLPAGGALSVAVALAPPADVEDQEEQAEPEDGMLALEP